jgi:MFS-type transporter involved in bile tolerance (Atg22 family)
MVRSIAAVAGGFVTMLAIVMVGTLAAVAAFVPGGLTTGMSQPPSGSLSRTYLAANLLVSLLGAIAGGWVTSRVAAASPSTHVLVLAGIILIMSVVTAAQGAAPGQPAWYPITISVIGLAGVLIGGAAAKRD